MRISMLTRLALTVFSLPFLLAGITVAVWTAAWVTETPSGGSSSWFLLIFLCLVPLGVLAGGLLAYGIVVFVVKWASPESALLVESEEVDGAFYRIVGPAFSAVRSFALWLAP